MRMRFPLEKEAGELDTEVNPLVFKLPDFNNRVEWVGIGFSQQKGYRTEEKEDSPQNAGRRVRMEENPHFLSINRNCSE